MRAESSTPTALMPSKTSFRRPTRPARKTAARARSPTDAAGAPSSSRSAPAASSETPGNPWRPAEPFSRCAKTTSVAREFSVGASTVASWSSPSSMAPAVSQASIRKMPSSSSRSRRSAMWSARQLEAGQLGGQLFRQAGQLLDVLPALLHALLGLHRRARDRLDRSRGRLGAPDLCLRRAGDFRGELGRGLRDLPDLLERFLRLEAHLVPGFHLPGSRLHRHHRLLGLDLHALDQSADVAGGLGGTLRQLPDLVGHDREPQPRLA